MTRRCPKACVLPCCRTRNAATKCGHWWCDPDHCTALNAFTSIDYHNPDTPEENE